MCQTNCRSRKLHCTRRKSQRYLRKFISSSTGLSIEWSTKDTSKMCIKAYVKNAKNTYNNIETIELRKTPRARWNYTAPCIPPWSPPSPSRRCIAEIDRGGSWRWWDSWWSVFFVRPWKWPIYPTKFFVPSSRPFRITLPGYLASENRTIIRRFSTSSHHMWKFINI